MPADAFRFDRFTLIPGERRLQDGAAPVELTGRYLDALTLLVREAGRLVSKDRFLDEVWRGVPVTDEALTQCIRTLRRVLGDSASDPRFIETVPKHGYRFVATVEACNGLPKALRDPTSDKAPPALPPTPLPASGLRRAAILTAAGTVGAILAGALGGLVYGFAAAAHLAQPGTGAASAVLVLFLVALVVALLGGAGVAGGIAGAGLLSGRPWRWSIAGGAFGGLTVGALVKLVGLDALQLLFGAAPAGITGAGEGLVLGAAAGLGAWIANHRPSPPRFRRGIAVAALVGGAGGACVALAGGRLLGGSLALLAASFPQSRLRMDATLGGLFGEAGFGPVSQALTAALEGAAFAACVVGGMVAARRWLGADTRG